MAFSTSIQKIGLDAKLSIILGGISKTTEGSLIAYMIVNDGVENGPGRSISRL